MGQPEAYGRGLCDFTLLPLDLEQGLPIVVRNGEGLGIVFIDDFLDLLIGSMLLEHGTGNNVQCISLRNRGTYRFLEFSPDAAVETVLDLRSHVGRIICLRHHVRYCVSVSIRNLVATGIKVLRIIGCRFRSTVSLIYIGLGRVRNMRIISPGLLTTGWYMGRTQRICYPESCIKVFVVENCVVSLKAALHLRSMGHHVKSLIHSYWSRKLHPRRIIQFRYNRIRLLNLLQMWMYHNRVGPDCFLRVPVGHFSRHATAIENIADSQYNKQYQQQREYDL